MTKRALCVGINDYPIEGMDLRGCVNDANNWASLLVEHYDFPISDVEVVLDAAATHDRVLDGLRTLVGGAKSGDVLVFTNSSHGTYLADLDGDEPDYDEAMCPYDTKEHPIVDDELYELFGNLAADVRLTVVSDSCHSGSVTRALPMPTPDDRRMRFLNPRAIGREEIPDVRAKSKRKKKRPESAMHEVLLSGCKSNQYSYDATIEGAAHGAFSFYAIAAIEEAKYKITYEQLHQQAVAALAKTNYDQQPQLEGKAANKGRQIFT